MSTLNSPFASTSARVNIRFSRPGLKFSIHVFEAKLCDKSNSPGDATQRSDQNPFDSLNLLSAQNRLRSYKVGEFCRTSSAPKISFLRPGLPLRMPYCPGSEQQAQAKTSSGDKPSHERLKNQQNKTNFIYLFSRSWKFCSICEKEISFYYFF